jgi:hypothetical protein
MCENLKSCTFLYFIVLWFQASQEASQEASVEGSQEGSGEDISMEDTELMTGLVDTMLVLWMSISHDLNKVLPFFLCFFTFLSNTRHRFERGQGSTLTF